MESAHISNKQLEQLQNGKSVSAKTDTGEQVRLPAEAVEPHLLAISKGQARIVRTNGRVINVALGEG